MYVMVAATPGVATLPVLLLLPLLVSITMAEREDCMEAQRRCASRLGCSIALSNYMLSCGPVVHGTTDQCTRECRMALITLLSMEDRQGETFMTCDCGGNQMCLDQKSRLEVCTDEVIQAMTSVMDNTTDISCTLAQLICSADTSCYTALSYYHSHCRKLMRGEKCTGRCNNSLQILYNRTKARKLRTCLCEGTEDYDCPGLKYNTETLCFRRQPHTVTRVTIPPMVPVTRPHRHHHTPRTRAPRPHPHPTHTTPPHTPQSPTKAVICDVVTDSPATSRAGQQQEEAAASAGSYSSSVTGPSLLAMLYLLTYSLSHCVLLNVSLFSCH